MKRTDELCSTVRLNAGLIQQFRIVCINEGLKPKEQFEKLLMEFMNNHFKNLGLVQKDSGS